MFASRMKILWIVAALLLCGLVSYGGPARLLTALAVMEPQSTPTISAEDKLYSPGEWLSLTGTGFHPGEVVQMEYYYGNLTNPNRVLLDTHPVLADSNGHFDDGFRFPEDSKPGIYGIRATGNMGSLATTKVVDPPGAILEGFQNIQNNWGGTLNAVKSVFGENDVVPLRMRASGLTAGQTVDITLKLDYKDTATGGNYFSDWFTTMPTQSSNGQLTNPCNGITCPGAVAQVAFPADDITGTYALPSGTTDKDAYKAQSSGQVLQIYGANAGTVTFVTQNTSDNTNYVACGTGTSGKYCIDTGSGVKKTVRLTFTASGTTAVLLYAGHTALGTTNVYGVGNGAANFSGGSGKFYAGVAGDAVKNVGLNGAVIITQTPDTITVSGNPNPSGVNQSVAVSATVVGQQGAPTGTVDFWETSQTNCGSITSSNSTLLGSGTLNNQGIATINYSWASAGTKPVWGCYNGDTKNLPNGATYNQDVQASVPGLSVGAATGPYAGSTTTNLTATLSNSSISVVNKQINFYLNGVAAGSAMTNSSGVATLSAPSSLAGINAASYGSSASQSDCTGVQGVCASFAGDGTLTAAARSNTLTVTKVHLTVTAENKNKTYDGNVYAPFTYTITGFVNGETDADLRTSGALSGNAGVSGSAATAVNAGTYAITPTQGNLAATNYDFTTFVNGTLVIDKLLVTGSFTASNKSYDGNTSATISTRSLSGVVGSDSVSLSGGTATFGDSSVANGKTVTATGFTLTGTAAGNYTLGSASSWTTTANITPKHITGSFTAANKPYDGNTDATVLTRSLSGVIAGDTASLDGGTASFASKTVGNGKTVTLTGASLTGASAGNYILDSVATTTANITALHITGNFTAANKTYDGNSSATVLTRTLNGTIGGDVVSLGGGTAAFSDKNVGTGKTVTLTGASLSGADAGNYALDSVATTTADITALHITGNFTASNKVYDGGTSATVLTRTLSGAIGGDTVSLSGGTAAFGDKAVGNGKTVTLTGASLSGTDSGNYILDSVGNATANITPLHITGAFTANDKVYDGGTSATAASRSLVGALGGDDVSLSAGTAAFANKNVGSGKTVNLSGASLSGADAGNYILDSVASTTANITALHITGSFTANNKVYDGGVAAVVGTRSLSGAIGGDTVSLTGGTASFGDKNVGTGKTVSLSGASLSGTDSGNYVLDSVSTALADITAKHISGTFTAGNKPYDGNISAVASNQSLVGAIAGDSVSLSGGTATFGDKNVGNGKTVTLSGASLSGTDAGNYVLDSVGTTTANITALHVTGSFTSSSKAYDGNNSASAANRSVTGAFAGDAVSLTGGTATFSDKNVGVGKTVTLSGATLSGADAGNYILDSVATTTADITPLHISGTFTSSNKTYDGNTSASAANRSLVGAIAGDVVSLSGGTASFSDKNVGAGKAVSLAGASLSGTSAGNYILDSVASTTADITPLHVTGSFTSSDKPYDGNTSAAAANRSVVGSIAGDAVSLTGGTAAFADKNVGNGKTVTLTGASLSGADAGNYILDSVSATTANITPIHITGTFTSSDKPYDGNTSAAAANRSLVGTIAGDVVSLTGGTAAFNNKNVGSGKPVTLTGASLSGANAGNYILDSVSATTASITALGVTGSFTAASKVYDGNTSATVLTRSLGGVLGLDNVTLTGGTASFSDKNVGNGKTVTLSGAGLSGTDAGNYSLISVATTTADITAKHITGSFTASNKVYDGNTSATALTRSLSGVIGPDNATLTGGTATFDTPAVGNGKTVTLSGASLAGTDAGNYILDSVSTTTANITGLGITGSFTADNKVYDGNTSATILTRSVSGVVGSDSVTLLGGSATFSDKNVGNGKTVTGTGFTLGGANAANYTLTSVATTTANITALGVTGNFTAGNKVYDGNTSASIATRSLNGGLSGDTVTLSGGSASFDDKNVGNGKNVTGSGFTLGGASAVNYSLTSVGNTAADITKRPASWGTNNKSKIYMDPDPAPLTNGAGSGFVTGEGASAAYSRNAGEFVSTYHIDTALTPTGSTSFDNYTLTNGGGNFNIMKAPSFVTLTAPGFVNYDSHPHGVTSAVAGTSSGTLEDPAVVTVNYTGTNGYNSTTPPIDAGTYTATGTYTGDSNHNGSTGALTFTINACGAVGPDGKIPGAGLYTGSMFFWTTSSSSSTASLALSATIKDLSCGGDITTALVTFIDRGTGKPIPNAQNLKVGRISPDVRDVGTVSALSQYDIGKTTTATTLDIGVIVGGNYNSNNPIYDNLITIAKPGVTNSMIGAGKISNRAKDASPESSGFLANGAGITDDPAELSTSVTYNKSGTNPQGKVVVTIFSRNKPDGSGLYDTPHKYQIISNAITEMKLVTQVNGTALQTTAVSFSSKVTVKDLTNGAGLDSGNMLQIVLTPAGVGQPNRASITIQKSQSVGGGLWYSSAWDWNYIPVPTTVLKALEAGSLIQIQ